MYVYTIISGYHELSLLAHTHTHTHTWTHRLAKKTEQFEVVQEKLHHSEEILSGMQGERSKLNREGSSRVANLNQALMQVQ